MPVQRKVFRIEENPRAMARGMTAHGVTNHGATNHGATNHGAERAPPPDPYLSELRALRALIEPRLPANREAMERARAQLAEAAAYRGELEAVLAAIESSRSTMAALDGAAPGEPPLARACRELDAIVAGTERAAQTILHAAEIIDEAATALRGAVDDADRQTPARDIRDQVAQIYQTCNFQDLTGQRVANVRAALRAIEAQLGGLTQIWRGIEQFQPVMFDDPADGDRRLLNGPKLAGDRGHVSQDDIDAMFGCA